MIDRENIAISTTSRAVPGAGATMAWIAAAMACCGCGAESGPRPVPVAGRVLTDAGQPCGGALVVFHPLAADRANAAKPVATSAEDGSFQLTTARPADGAIPGDYAVTVVWPEPARAGKVSLSSEASGGGPDRLGGRYGNPGRPQIKVTVPPSGENGLTIEVNRKR